MFEITGKYATAKVYAEQCDEASQRQILQLCNQPFAEGANIRIMPDVHAGKGCVVGFTCKVTDKVVPNLVGVDIGCGVLTVPLGKVNWDFKKLDAVVRTNVPSGRNIRNEALQEFGEFSELKCYKALAYTYSNVIASLGTLGGGNHFISIECDETGNSYLLIHTGSRHFGLTVCQHYQALAEKHCMHGDYSAVIEELKARGLECEIEDRLNLLKKQQPSVPKELMYLEGEELNNYLHDMQITQRYAALNRWHIAKQIVENYFKDCNVRWSSTYKLKIKQKGKPTIDTQAFDTVHNYIDENNYLRKGSVAAYTGKSLVVPINMRDGSLICTGLGVPEWNFSAPHGAGRRLSRSQAKDQLSVEEYKKQMEGIFTTCANEATLDEAPDAYKSVDDILSQLKETVNIVHHVKPVYNFKASEADEPKRKSQSYEANAAAIAERYLWY